ncbi:MAG: glycosyltransferase [Eubacteriales bacterium]|nr:glycosyltransferase [Eubacteriales bacterium]
MRVAIVSLNFSPGHIAHLRAYQKLYQEIADEVTMFLHPDYESMMEHIADVCYTQDPDEVMKYNPHLVFTYNIAMQNIRLAKRCKRKRTPFYYVLHEPFGGFRNLFKEKGEIVKTIGALLVNICITGNSAKVLLASDVGRDNYEKYMKWCNKNYDVFPLIFCDEFDTVRTIKRKYIAFIGGFLEAHACKEFLSFMEYALDKDDDINFLIATKLNIDNYLKSEKIQKALEDGRLKVQSGRPMTTEEINIFYRESLCVWNAYNRSTQSGVMPNALMQGTPLLVNKNGAAKGIIEDKINGYYVKTPHNNEEIMEACQYIREHIEDMEKACRDVFLKEYCYEGHIELAKKVILQ